MSKVTFITGNEGKADFLAKYLGFDIPHRKLDLEEIQSLNLEEITKHKALQAYSVIKSPVLVEDVAFTFEALNQLPGPLIKWFLESIGKERICRLLDSFDSRRAYGEVCYVYYDGKNTKVFNGKVYGFVPDHPRGDKLFGWDYIFIPDGSDKTYSEMDNEELEKFSLRTTTVYPQIREFLKMLDREKA